MAEDVRVPIVLIVSLSHSLTLSGAIISENRQTPNKGKLIQGKPNKRKPIKGNPKKGKQNKGNLNKGN